LGKIAFRTGFAYSWHTLSTSRTAAFAGFSNVLTSEYKARTLQGFAELGYGFASGKVAFEPFANIAYVRSSTDGFDEKGGVAALNGAPEKSRNGFTTLGLRARSDLGTGDNGGVSLHGQFGWRHGLGEMTPVSTQAFGGSPFEIAGAPLARDVATLDLGADFRLRPNTTLGISYGGQAGSGGGDQTVRANFIVRF
jgi:outer membrane autotransporter protein